MNLVIKYVHRSKFNMNVNMTNSNTAHKKTDRDYITSSKMTFLNVKKHV